MAKRNNKVVFKPYTPDQLSLLPPSLDELIPANHPVRIVNEVIDRIDLAPLLKQYKGGGSSSYHPKMMLKVLIYGYVTNTYTSRKLEEGLNENIHFMWLSGMRKVDHNTINRFRSERLKGVLKEVFSQVVELLAEEGLLTLKTIYTDGTKIEANANKYTFVWGKSIKTSKDRIKKQLNELWVYTQKIAQAELKDSSPLEFDEIDTEKVQATIERINEALGDKVADKKMKQKLDYGKKNWPKNLAKYDEQEKLLAGRGSYSKTDPDATFMRMKEDHMKNGQLKAGYNLQMSTNDQFIVNYSIHQTTGDTTTLTAHLEQHRDLYEELPKELCADAGYGSEENYEYLQGNEIDGYVKYNYFHKEQNDKKWQNDPFKPDHLHYNAEKDCFYCPMGQVMEKIDEKIQQTTTGYQQQISLYQARSCQGCPLRGQCHKAKGNRIIQVNHRLNELKREARKRLLSDQGIKHRKKRPCDVETVFGNIKNNHGFRRFLLRGLEKVEIEAGLIALAHNLRKMAA